jgi:hypothetical protein
MDASATRTVRRWWAGRILHRPLGRRSLAGLDAAEDEELLALTRSEEFGVFVDCEVAKADDKSFTVLLVNAESIKEAELASAFIDHLEKDRKKEGIVEQGSP